MYKKKKDKPAQTASQKIESYLNENVVSDLRTCFSFYDKTGRGEISRDNLKSIMENFGWLNRPAKEIELCIETVYPSYEDKKKKDLFSFDEVQELIAEFWVKRGYMENEFAEMFAIFDKK